MYTAGPACTSCQGSALIAAQQGGYPQVYTGQEPPRGQTGTAHFGIYTGSL